MKLPTKNDELTLTIQSIGYNGEGVSKDFEIPIFVPFALTDEQVKVRIIFAKKQFAIGKLMQIIKSSPDRVIAQCPVFGKCGGCDLQHYCYEKQLEFKQNHVADCFNKIANKPVTINQTIPSPNQYAYRNKFSVPIREVNGEVQIGFFAANSHRIVPMKECFLQEEWANQLINSLIEYITNNNVSVYNEDLQQGLLRHLVARKFNNQLQIALVLNGKALPNLENWCKKLQTIFPVLSVYTNENTSQSNVIFGKNFVHVFGNKTITQNIMGLQVHVVPASFMQVNTQIQNMLYTKVLNEIDSGCDIIIDAYSGAGTLTNLFALKYPNKQVFGIEIVPEAVISGIAVASQNNIGNVQHIVGDCEIKLPNLLKEHAFKNICLVLDPPRKGCSKSILETAIECGVKKVIYISCDPATLARDVKILLDTASKTIQDYKINFVQPYDMFPQTKHVETLIAMKKI